LETKGDANTYTDQAGPHIPEPYIKESNLMGKVISIGQQPLKVPFVGYLGLWINQGLDLLSQPTTSKGSVGYAGIFAPLTISAVILVILIFVLPEKAKTFKEKIRFNIFGPRPLNLKKTLASFLVAYIVFFTVIHVFAYDSTTASVGIEAPSEDAGLDFGRISAGSESHPIELPLINPSTMPVKGIIFGRGEMSDYLSRKTFELQRGEMKNTNLRAISNSNSPQGTYHGEVMVYSSPFWFMIPDDIINGILSWNSEATVFILDLFSAIILTSITLTMLLGITLISDKLSRWAIDRSWIHPSRLLLKKDFVQRFYMKKKNIRRSLRKNMGWILRIDFSESGQNVKKSSPLIKPFIAGLLMIPLLYYLTDKMLAMFMAVIIAGLMAYCISCKLRYKIVLATLVIMTLAIANMIIQSNLLILSKNQPTLEMLTLAIGAMGIYLLLFSLLLLPLSLVSWAIVRYIRNLKERKDPLLSLDGSCDL
jgi:hypothetical protein